MKLYSYIISRDYGFAPNPFHGYCTLATCKPTTRNIAKVGDWIIGIGSKSLDSGTAYNELIFAMKVTEKLTFNQYWEDERFQVKKPVLNGSLMQAYGDNIYHFDGSTWIQADSHHSLENGVLNEANLRKDTSSDSVLISNDFYYFGTEHIAIPERFNDYIIKGGANHKCIQDEETINDFDCWLAANNEYKNYLYGFPIHFEEFKRYDGKS